MKVLARGKSQITAISTEMWMKILKARSLRTFRTPRDFKDSEKIENLLKGGMREWK